MHGFVIALALVSGARLDDTPSGTGADLVTALTSAIATNTPYIIGVIAALVGLGFLLALGRYIQKRSSGAVK
ncbi:MAG TPA: hypothetical protein VHZ81_05690 [Galbitalea sp.]|jgi:hypothetical protein|nr:hypothetical protein [Galbitalea sp.]